jgi:hypothetical protein
MLLTAAKSLAKAVAENSFLAGIKMGVLEGEYAIGEKALLEAEAIRLDMPACW